MFYLLPSTIIVCGVSCWLCCRGKVGVDVVSFALLVGLRMRVRQLSAFVAPSAIRLSAGNEKLYNTFLYSIRKKYVLQRSSSCSVFFFFKYVCVFRYTLLCVPSISRPCFGAFPVRIQSKLYYYHNMIRNSGINSISTTIYR